ncbi:MAG: STAS domain-containing protein [Oscillospiraceae bacterium]|nr:STAS domain-containing protein [Oscillospiraceae bacterium]
MNDDFAITEEKTDDATRFYVKGRVTSVSANVLRHKLNESFQMGRDNIIVNMMETTFLSSAGIRVLLMFYKRAKESSGSFYVESPSDNVVNVLGLTALDELLLKE